MNSRPLLINYIDEGKVSGRPFFGYVAFTTAHFPIQAPSALIGKYVDAYRELSEEEREIRTRLFATFAAMVESQDYHIGRLMDYLRETGQLDNTLVIYLTDNGPEGADAFGTLGNKTWTDWIEANYSMALEDIGTSASSHRSWSVASPWGLPHDVSDHLLPL